MGNDNKPIVAFPGTDTNNSVMECIKKIENEAMHGNVDDVMIVIRKKLPGGECSLMWCGNCTDWENKAAMASFLFTKVNGG